MTIKISWNGKRATRLGVLVLLWVDIYYMFPEIAFYIVVGMTFFLGFVIKN